MNDNYDETTNKNCDDEETVYKALYKLSSKHNENSKTINANHDRTNRILSNSNIFSRLMRSEPHVQKKK